MTRRIAAPAPAGVSVFGSQHKIAIMRLLPVEDDPMIAEHILDRYTASAALLAFMVVMFHQLAADLQ